MKKSILKHIFFEKKCPKENNVLKKSISLHRFKKTSFFFQFLKSKENEKISIFVRSIRCCIFRILR